ncbi:Leucine-rich repeat-containing protein [Cynara cardunculus var. scolymus]|uniref:Leucine-rich repeat-containing protein n=1 Tax=Cynara cardunculus var. scolymus TaxID=59895 RepID=A0A103XEZ9_CYNCS|nr:Leucine-rich repeat-containing protein [Cynara cardunculus var. scolymus]
MAAKKPEFILFLTLNFVVLLRFAESVVPQQEEQAVGNILAAMNATSWRFNGDSCNLETISEVAKPTQEANASVGCDCTVGNDSDCHVVRIDVAYNYLQGTIPPEWGLTQLQDISLLGNRLTGEIPPELGNITTLTKLILSSNRLTGRLPTALGQLGNLTNLRISDITGPTQGFPPLNNATGLIRLQDVLPCAEDIECPRCEYSSSLNP